MVYTEIHIDRPPAEVRANFLEWDNIRDWHQGYLQSLKPADPAKSPSTVEEGDKLEAKLGGRDLTVTVVRNTPEEFVWEGKIPGIIYGEHSFKFQPSEDPAGGTRFIQMEEFSGVLGFLGWPGWILDRQTSQNFPVFNEDLKRRCEGPSSKQTRSRM